MHLDISSGHAAFQTITDLVKPFYFFGKLKQTHLKKNSSCQRSVLSRLVDILSSIPKSWFGHFYVVGFLVHSLILWLLIALAKQTIVVPEVLRDISIFLHFFDTSNKGYLDQVQSFYPLLVVFVCEEVQLLRRIYECYFVSSFSNGTISIVHYFYGVTFYTLFGFGILVSLPVHKFEFSDAFDSFDAFYCGLGVFGFCVASYFQHKTMQTFAALRSKEKNKPAKGHFIPEGHLFHWVSSPHYLCEILIYLSLCLILRWKSMYLMSATLFVLVNQISASLSVHRWYRRTFQNFPKNRKALVPYLL
ncbi:hypothetical protein RRG08_052049 [Elysia crispata]|uniref:Polyprenal reductase n=1 Tax=Elysia crispata TaxID=231223 RepID=A0AAE1A580_9GAST|nr:hypothetical protein RRG08_052049 [Elysia crispata]